MATFMDCDELRLFVKLNKESVSHSPSGSVRLTLSQAADYVRSFPGYSTLTVAWRQNRSIRLGRRALLPVWALTPEELGILAMSPRDFGQNYVSDPRGRLTFSEVVRRETRHKPVCVGIPAPAYQHSGTCITSSVLTEPRFVRSNLVAPLRPRLRDRRGKPLKSKMRLHNRVVALFYSLPLEARRAKIPQWYPEVICKPRYLFRLKGRDMSLPQRVVSTLCRVYHWYRFHLARSLAGTSKLIKFGRGDSIYRVLAHPMGPRWYTMASIVYRRLKVLLKPLWA